jgi:hypothetical protein
LNELIRWIQENRKLVLILFLFLVLISAGVGFVLGTVKGRSSSAVHSLSEIGESASTLTAPQQKRLLLPDPAIPHVIDPFPSFSFYFEHTDLSQEELKPLPTRVSELLRYRDVGVKTNIQPFQFRSEEYEVLMQSEQLAEP